MLKLPGTESEEPALALVTEAQGDAESAIRILRDRRDSESVATLIGVIARAKGDDAALNWIASERIDIGDLTMSGYISLSQVYIRLNQVDAVRSLLLKLFTGRFFNARVRSKSTTQSQPARRPRSGFRRVLY